MNSIVALKAHFINCVSETHLNQNLVLQETKTIKTYINDES